MKNITIFKKYFENQIYSKLRSHLNTMPIGFPRTITGVEIKLLKDLFTPENADIARYMDWHFHTASQIFDDLPSRLKSKYIDPHILTVCLNDMARAGAILRRTEAASYALVPFIVGMYEFQINTITADFYDKKVMPYLKGGFALEYLATSLPQTRIIPVKESIPIEHLCAQWDDLDRIIDDTKGDIALIGCICRKVADLKSLPCKATDRREICMVFNDYADSILREGWGRKITKDEAHASALQSRKEGLILQPSNEKDPQVVCACCGCCCGLLGLFTFFPRPADFLHSNYEVKIKDGCRGCNLCVQFCQMQAITVTDKKPFIDTARCAGCGICASKCSFGALQMKQKARISEPPQNTEELLTILGQKKPGIFKKITVGVRAVFGIPQKR